MSSYKQDPDCSVLGLDPRLELELDCVEEDGGLGKKS